MAHNDQLADGSRPTAGVDRKERAPEQYGFNRFTLFFNDREEESRFVEESLQKSLPFIRQSLFSGAVLYAVFGLLDYIMLGPDATLLWIIRYAVVCPVLLILTALTFHPAFSRMSQPVLAMSSLSAGAGVVAMTAVTDPPVNYYYYAGLILVVIYVSSLVRLRFQYSAACALALVIAYNLATILINPVPMKTLANNNFTLIMAMTVGIVSNFALELYYRKDYISRQLLIGEKALSDRLLIEAQAANEAKSNFLAVVSHELRTPLNAIIGFSEMMRMKMFGPLGSEQYEGYAHDIHKSGRHLLDIINDILDLSKAEAGKLELQETEINLDAMIEDCMRIFRDKASESGLTLSYDPRQPVTLHADTRLMRQVLINLISNAVKFTLQGGSVSVTVRRTDAGACRIEVADTGVGIQESDIPNVLEPFVQVENPLSRTHEGTGLGLPLVRKIVELHGGRITVDSELGVGTKVTASIPAERVMIWSEEQELAPRALAAS